MGIGLGAHQNGQAQNPVGRTFPETCTTVVTVDSDREWVLSGLKDLVILKSTGSEFRGFLTDRYTTLQETSDRIMATSLTARWRYRGTDADWDATYAGIRAVLLA